MANRSTLKHRNYYYHQTWFLSVIKVQLCLAVLRLTLVILTKLTSAEYLTAISSVLLGRTWGKIACQFFFLLPFVASFYRIFWNCSSVIFGLWLDIVAAWRLFKCCSIYKNPTFDQKRIIILYFLAGVHQGTIIMYWGRLCRPSHKSNQPLFKGVCDMFPMLTMSRGTKTVGAMSINCFRRHRHQLCSYGAGRPFKCVNFKC